MELVLSLVLIAVLAVAVGHSLSSSRQSTSRIKSALAQVRQRDDLVHRISEQLRYAVQIQDLYSNYIKFDSPAPDGISPPQTISYYWNTSTHDLSFWNRDEMPSSEVIHSDVPVFEIQYAETKTDDSGDPHCQTLQIKIQLTQNSSDTLSETIHLVNMPEIGNW
ncbi:MAG: hypothetical protein JXD22_14160 [Sedimentisphaerales bacterium]|nr:hypothetical protein [Sedimentisphaerales bacterium]